MTNFGERFNIHFDLSIEPEISKGLNVKNRRKPKQDLVIGQTGSLGELAFGNYVDHAVKWLISGRLAFAIQCVKARHSQLMKEMTTQIEGISTQVWSGLILLVWLRKCHRNWIKPLHKRVFERNLSRSLVKTHEGGISLHFLMMLYLWIVNFKPF